jgi:Met-zincin
MNRSSSLSRISMTVGAAALAQALAGCAGQGDIDRSQPDKMPKAMFFAADGKTPKIFYYRQTYVDVPATSGWTFEGMMGDLDKVRFDIQKDYLVGYRSYDYAPGASNPINGGINNQDTPLVIFKITSQFDVKREYNAGTGEQTNVISENTTDRPWYDRDYMRVDWSQNLVENAIDTSSPTAVFVPATRIPITQDGVANPDHPVISDSYFDVTVREVHTPDYNACIQMFHPGMDDGAWYDCGPAELKVRHSFMEVPASTYVPLSYPDREPLLGNDGQAIRLANGAFPCSKQVIAQSGGTDCASASVDQFAKFGFFRTVRQTYDPKYGVTEQGRLYYANRWNIWKDAAAASKAVAPDRTTRQITYYTNPEFPDDDPELMDMAKTVVGSWNDAMKQTVAALKVTEPARSSIMPLSSVETAAMGIDDIFVLKQNSCNIQGVKDFVAAHADLASVVEDTIGDKVDNLDKSHLLQACTALDQATETLAADNPKRFTWQRNGDLRYSFLDWVARPQLQGPLGYGPSSVDPETGEIISASAYIYGAALNTYAQTAVEAVQLLNNAISIDDILSGKTIADVVAENTATRKAQKALPLTAEAKAMASAMLDRGASSHTGSTNGANRLVQIPPGAADLKLAAIKGTEVENQMMTTDILNMFGSYSPQLPSQNPDLYAQILEMARPENLISVKAKQARANRFQTLATHGCVYMEDFADDSVIGTALELAGLPPDEIYKRLRAAIFRGVSEHELGHTMGLRHNFAGSTDALNYADDYWNIRTTLPEAQWHDNKLSEFQYSTVMDYGAKFNSDVHGLGKYDHAAIRFGYGQIVDAIPAASDTGIGLSDDIFFNDYQKIPALVGGTDKMNAAATGVVRYQAIKDSTRGGYLDPTYRGGVPITAERPYKFCSDEFVGSLDCKPWDEGANQTEIIDNTIDHFKNYYFFDAFRRDRIRWTIDGYFNRMSDRYFARYTEAFQFYYFFGSALGGSDLQNDLLRASVDSLNSLGEILETPEPGQHCATAISPNVLVLPSQSGPNACQNGTGMQVDIGPGKPYFIAFSPDYYYRITRAGSLYEKLAALEALTTTASRFFRVDTFADSNQYSINYYRIFKDQMLNLISGVIRNDPSMYGGYVDQGQFVATPVVDLTTYGKVTYPPPLYLQPGTRRVDTPVNKTIRYWALGLTLANLDSSWDSTLDISNYLNVTLKGAVDDVTYDPSIPIKEFTHPQSGQTFRAAHLDSQRSGVGESLIDELNMIAGTKGTPGTLPAKFGYVNGAGDAYPDWWTAKANLDTATAGTDQAAFQYATAVFQNVDYLLSYRVDLLSDLRRFRTAFGY